jgi:tyrosinase
MNNIHRCPAFLPWHRQFILDYEHDLQEASGNPNLGPPYWNWVDDAALPDPTSGPVWADDFLGGNGDSSDGGIVKTGPFREGEWTIIDGNGNPDGPLIRRFGEASSAPTLPSQTDVNNALATTPYDSSPWDRFVNPSFRNRLEGWYGALGPGLHNRGHVWVGGSMLPMTSPNDPIVFLHHCFVDKLWADWQARLSKPAISPAKRRPRGLKPK